MCRAYKSINRILLTVEFEEITDVIRAEWSIGCGMAKSDKLSTIVIGYESRLDSIREILRFIHDSQLQPFAHMLENERCEVAVKSNLDLTSETIDGYILMIGNVGQVRVVVF